MRTSLKLTTLIILKDTIQSAVADSITSNMKFMQIIGYNNLWN